MKNKLRAVVVTVGIFGASNSFAGIPVIDGVSNGMRIAEFAQTVVQWGKEISEMQAQYQELVAQNEQLTQTFESMTGGRGYSDYLNSGQYQQARRYLPDDAQQVLDLAAGNSGGAYSSLYEAMGNIKEQSTTLNDDSFGSETAATQWDADINRASSNKALSMAAYSSAAKRMQNLEAMVNEISRTEDPKAIAELQSRINAEQGLIQNEQAKLQALSMLASAEQKISQQQARETSIKMAGKLADVPRVQITP